jgi:hypothetical protein
MIPEGVGMESDRISTIEDWPTPKLVRDVQGLLGFANFYRRFITKYAKVTTPISHLLKTTGSPKWEWTQDAELAFRKLRKAFTEAPIHQHFDPTKQIILQTSPSGFAIAGIHNQYGRVRTLRPVNFYSGQCTTAKQNYDTYDRELLAIVETMKQWWHDLEGANHKVLIRCDHKNLKDFHTSKVLSRRQARWAEILSSCNCVIEDWEGKKNLADGPSRCYWGTKVSILSTSTAVDPISSYSFRLDLLLPIFSFDVLKVSVPLSQDSTASI